MYLSELTANIAEIENAGQELDIKGLCLDSRRAEEGFLFAAIKGNKIDGTQFIQQAVVAGAVAVLVDNDAEIAIDGVAVVRSDNPRKAIAKIAARLLGGQIERTVAVTGTNGKSSTVNFCRQIWDMSGQSAASLGTIGIASKNYNKEGTLTTPDPITLHSEIRELADTGVKRLAVEASSQGLDQYRLDGLEIAAGAFTNLTHDHLDYHGSMENYLKCKLRLFSEILKEKSVLVLNRDVPYAEEFEKLANLKDFKIIDYGYNAKRIKIIKCEPALSGQFVEVEIFGKNYKLNIPLVGKFQIYNALCALGLVVSEDVQNEDFVANAVASLEKLQTVRGRLELAAVMKNGATIYVDYAHTPDGVETLLKSIRPHVKNKLHAIVGCGGDRDKTKRPIMGKLAVDLADVAIVTDDNPRTEDPNQIRSEVMSGAVGATEIAGRDKAIREAVKNLQEGDILVVAGKGHEQGQEINGVKHHFDDVEEVKKAVAEVEI